MLEKLKQLLTTKPFNYISDILDAFELCTNWDDVNEVIGSIPNKFGSFDSEIESDSEDNIDGFTIHNTYYDKNSDDVITEEYFINWYTEEVSDKSYNYGVSIVQTDPDGVVKEIGYYDLLSDEEIDSEEVIAMIFDSLESEVN